MALKNYVFHLRVEVDDSVEQVRLKNSERKHKHHYTKRSHKKKDRKMVKRKLKYSGYL